MKKTKLSWLEFLYQILLERFARKGWEHECSLVDLLVVVLA